MSTKNIVGYFHICQKDNWERSFDLIMDSIKKSGLYEATSEIRCGIVNDKSVPDFNYRFNDPKLNVVATGCSSEYERPTLLHMREHSESDPPNTSYWYLHTKGIRHFGTDTEENVVDWINLLLYWNVYKWKIAITSLNSYDTYGCNGVLWQGHLHYSGNFWWANSDHIKRLPNSIGESYTDPEFWICVNEPKMWCNIYTNDLAGGRNYCVRLPQHVYEIPENFDIEIYKNANPDLTHFQYPELISHYLTYGKHESRIFC